MNCVILLDIDKDRIKPSDREFSARMGSRESRISDYPEERDMIYKNMSPRGAFLPVPVKIEGDITDLSVFKTESSALRRVLSGCDYAVIFAITLGSSVDRVIKQGAYKSRLFEFVLDAMASTYAEALCELCEGKIVKILNETEPCESICRFSVGYSDLPLSHQAEVIAALGGSQALGISLSDSFLMTPSKSVSAILGIKRKC
jgi:hypothetical protein